MTHLKIAGYGSLALFSPYFFFELWGFIKPGLHSREKKLVVPFVLSGHVFFPGRRRFCLFRALPGRIQIFVSYGAPTDVPLLTIDSYYSTCLKLLLLFGLAFELPVLVCLFGYLGDGGCRHVKQHRKTAIIGISIVAALFAPPDAVSMLILGAPLILLFELSIWVVQWMGIKREAVSGTEVAPSPDPAKAEGTHPWEGRSK